jgi:hypothetical protein
VRHRRGRAELPLQSKANKMTKRIARTAALCALAGCSVPMQTVDASRAACASYGFQPGSDAFAECVMTEQHRHTLLIYGGGAGGPVPAVPQTDFGGQSGQPVISSGDCIGAVVNGVCHGTPAPGAPTATCHGQMVGGVCRPGLLAPSSPRRRLILLTTNRIDGRPGSWFRQLPAYHKGK